jgi:hypothetical protein
VLTGNDFSRAATAVRRAPDVKKNAITLLANRHK